MKHILLIAAFVLLVWASGCLTYKINHTRNPNAPEWTKYLK